MTRRTLVHLTLAAGGLLGLWLLASLLSSGSSAPAAGPDDWSAFFGALRPESTRSVRIEGPGGARTLSREGATWTIDGFPADSGTVARFWAAVSDTTPPELVARNPANHARMGLAADSAIVMAFASDGDTLRLLLGDEGPGRGTSYLRRSGNDASYLSRRNLRGYAERTVEDWRDKRVIAVDTAALVQVEVRRPGQAYTLARLDSTWTVTPRGAPASAGVAADPGLVRSLLGGLADLPAVGFFADDDLPDPAEGDISITAVGNADDTLAVVEIGALESEWWATASGNETVFRVPGFRVQQLAPSMDALRANP